MRVRARRAISERISDGAELQMVVSELYANLPLPLVVDADALACCVRASTDPAATRAVFARHGLDAPRRWAARGSARVGIDATAEVAGLVETLLRESGVTGPVADHDPDVVLVLRESEGEPDLVDAWARDEVPHLVVSSSGDTVTIGPFVEPGATACVRCVDAHHRDSDPRRPLVLEQHRRQSGPLVRDPLLRRLSLAWAVRDLVSWVDGDRPSSWSATVTLDARLEATRTTWSRHPYCGCGWAEPHQYSGASLPSIDLRCSREHRSQ